MPRTLRWRRKSLRLKEWDYRTPAAYFVTICTHDRVPLFGRVVDGDMVLNTFGKIVWAEWFRIVWIVETDNGTGRSPLQPRGHARINALRGTPGAPVWQRNYYEHIIRTERALNAIRRYIAENPLRWHLDRYNPNATGADPQARDLWRMLQSEGKVPPRPKSKSKGGVP